MDKEDLEKIRKPKGKISKIKVKEVTQSSILKLLNVGLKKSNLEEYLKKNPGNIAAQSLMGIMGQVCEMNQIEFLDESKTYWDKTFDLVFQNPEKYRFGRIGETKCEVYKVEFGELGGIEKEELFKRVFKDPHCAFVIKKLEKDKLSESRDILDNFVGKQKKKIHQFSEPCYYIEREDGFYEIMVHVGGKTFFEKIEVADPSGLRDLAEITDFLAFIHANIPIEKSKKGKINLLGKLKNRLERKELGLPSELIGKFIDNYRPIEDALYESVLGFNKDAHPENWVVADDGTITALDWEDKGLVPVQIDLVNLLEYGSYFNWSIKDDVIERYIFHYNKNKREDVIKNKEWFKIGYLNAIIQRTVLLTSAWSSPDRGSMKSRRKTLVNNALSGLGALKAVYGKYYSCYKDNYGNLEKGLLELRELVSNP